VLLAPVSLLSQDSFQLSSLQGRRLNKKVTKHKKTISLIESSNLSINKLISKASNDNYVSDVEFDLILREVKQYGIMKGLRSNASEASKPSVDVKALKEEIKKEYQRKLGSLVNLKN